MKPVNYALFTIATATILSERAESFRPSCLLIESPSLSQEKLEKPFLRPGPFVTLPIEHHAPVASTVKLFETKVVQGAESDGLIPFEKMVESVSRNAIAFLLSALLVLSPTVPHAAFSVAGGTASAAESARVIGEIKGSGLVFKDTLKVESFDDPKVQGVTLYITNFERPLTERLQKDFFSDPSYASVSCAKTGPVKIADNIALGTGGEEVFEESRSLLFKALRVQRIYDKEKNTVVYVSFNTRLDKSSDSNKSRFKSSVCAVNLD